MLPAGAVSTAKSPPPSTQIDTLVYELYGFTDDEIKLVEGR